MNDTRVVITGLGAVTPIGNNAEEFGRSLFEGVSGTGPITHFDCEVRDPRTDRHQFTTRIAGEVKDFDPHTVAQRPERLDRATHFAFAAADMALSDAGLTTQTIVPERTGVVVGTGMGDMVTIEGGIELILKGSTRRIRPTALPKVLPSSLPGSVAIRLGSRGVTMGISTACASSTHAVGEAYWVIRRGDADVVMAGGAEAAITPLSLAAFGAMRVLSRNNEEPEKASRPFDARRDGFVMGEGSGLMVIERLESAQRRGAHIYAEILGYKATSDAFHATGMRADVSEYVRVMTQAMEMGGVGAAEIDSVNAHGSSTPMNDAVETKAIKAVFGERVHEIPVNATKSMTGHLLSAGAGIEIIAVLLSFEKQRVHPTINYEAPDPECDLDYVVDGSRDMTLNTVLKNSFGMGGHNSALVLRRWEN